MSIYKFDELKIIYRDGSTGPTISSEFHGIVEHEKENKALRAELDNLEGK